MGWTVTNGSVFNLIHTQAVVPVLFIMIRLWGSVRAILYFANPSDSSAEFSHADRWLQYLQAAFDPSQGFFNFVVFVASSREGRANFYASARHYLHRTLVFIVSALCWLSAGGGAPGGEEKEGGEDSKSAIKEALRSESETSPFAEGHRIHSDSSLSKLSMEGGLSQVSSVHKSVPADYDDTNDYNNTSSSTGMQSPTVGSLTDYTVLRSDEAFEAYYGAEEGVTVT
jgi:hypothetical protein